MARNSGRYAKGRQKVKKPDQTKETPFKKELDNRRNKRIIWVVVAVIIIAMVSTLIIPYISGSGQKNWSLPAETLKADETSADTTFNAKTITLGETFTRSDSEYYVLFGESENISNVEANLMRVSYYTVDPTLFENKTLTENTSKGASLPQKASDIKLKDKLAIIQIKNGKAVKFVSGKSNVESFAKELNK